MEHSQTLFRSGYGLQQSVVVAGGTALSKKSCSPARVKNGGVAADGFNFCQRHCCCSFSRGGNAEGVRFVDRVTWKDRADESGRSGRRCSRRDKSRKLRSEGGELHVSHVLGLANCESCLITQTQQG